MKSSLGINILLMLTMTRIFFVSSTCHRAEYQIGPECCQKCPAGSWVNKHCAEFQSTFCRPCAKGTFMDEPTGMTQCFECRICDSGLKVKTVCSTTSNAVCEPEDGYFCVDSPKDGHCSACQKHKDCDPGQYIDQPGSASADTVCSPCAEGTFSNGTLSRCQSHTQCELMDKDTVKPGTLSSDAECGDKNSITKIVVGFLTGVLLLAVLISVGFYFFCCKKKNNANEGVV